jgi:hypothetical protein
MNDIMLSVANKPFMLCLRAECHYAECRYAECRYTECRYAECRGASKMIEHECYIAIMTFVPINFVVMPFVPIHFAQMAYTLLNLVL